MVALHRRHLLQGGLAALLPATPGHAALSQIAQPTQNINLIVISGQSLAIGALGWPPLSTAQKYDSVMLGGSTRGATSGGIAGPGQTQWTVYGKPVFNPMIAVCQAANKPLQTPAQMHAYPRTGGAAGESIEIGAVNQFRRLWLQHHNLKSDPAHRLATVSCGVPGAKIAALSRGATPDLWNRVVTGVTAVKNGATAAGLSFGITALIWIQGEDDGHSARAGAYQTALQQYYADFLKYVVQDIAGQSAPPAMFTYQTSGPGAVDNTELGPPMGQLNQAVENSQSGWSLFAPYYQVTDKGAHLDANAYRWLGQKCGQVMHQVITLRKPWLPLYPTSVKLHGTQVTIDYHVPVPPLVFDTPYVFDTPTDYPDKGFTVFEGLKATPSRPTVPIDRVAITSPTTVVLTLARAPGSCTVAYGDQTHHGGNGCLRDSDPFVSDDLYTYDPSYTRWPEQNIPALVDRPYPQFNWSCIWWLNALTV